jgi:cytosine/adenosine deaminase-related metal-dependent hydrolase
MFTLRARWVLPVDHPPIDGGYVSVAQGRVVAVAVSNPGVGMVEDLGDVALLPGLVNAHTHLEFSDLERPLGTLGMSLPAWIRLVIADRKRGDRDPAASIAAGLREAVAAGVTTIGEIATSPASLYLAMDGGPTTLLLHEAIGFSAGRVDSVYADLVRRLDASPRGGALSPHAPYTVHPRLLERLVKLAKARNATVAMHLAESREELQLLATGDGPFRDLLIERSMWDESAIPQGSRPLHYLRVLAEAPRAVVIHGNYLADDEVEFIARRRDSMSVVYCPRTHAYFQHSSYPLEAMLNAGIRVSLGTDSRASNRDLCLLNEVHQAAATHTTISAEAWLRMATINGAEALGMADSVGTLAPGKWADMIALPFTSDLNDPYAVLLGAADRPSRVWLRGAEPAAA